MPQTARAQIPRPQSPDLASANAIPAQPEAKKAPYQGEVLPPEVIDIVREKVGERGRNRTFNLLIKSKSELTGASSWFHHPNQQFTHNRARTEAF